MDDGEVEPCDLNFLQHSSTSTSNNTTTILDELLSNSRTTCTHTHTCSPPGPDAVHTHTCYHTHMQVFSSEEDTKNRCETSSMKPVRPVGNREAVRKYREKKKAHTAYLEEEVKKLRLWNQHLVKKVQGQAALEAELLRLRSLLVNLRGKIDVELDSFRLRDIDVSSSLKEGEYGIQTSREIRLQCKTQVPCFLQQGNESMGVGDGLGVDNGVFSWQERCQPVIVDCHVIGNGMVGGSDHPLELEDMKALGIAKNQSQ